MRQTPDLKHLEQAMSEDLYSKRAADARSAIRPWPKWSSRQRDRFAETFVVYVARDIIGPARWLALTSAHDMESLRTLLNDRIPHTPAWVILLDRAWRAYMETFYDVTVEYAIKAALSAFSTDVYRDEVCYRLVSALMDACIAAEGVTDEES